MPGKLHFKSKIGIKIRIKWNNDGLPNLRVMKSYEGKQSNITKNMNNIDVVPKDVQRIILSHKILWKYNKQDVSYKKVVPKNLAIFTWKQLSESLFFHKNAGF